MYKNLIELFKENEGKGAVGAFNLHCFEMLPAMIKAAEEINVPIIIQTSLGTAEYIGFEPLIAAVKALAEKSTVSVALHMDHCKDIEKLKKAIDCGYSSVMYDGSSLPIEENIKSENHKTCGIRVKNGSTITLNGKNTHKNDKDDILKINKSNEPDNTINDTANQYLEIYTSSSTSTTTNPPIETITTTTTKYRKQEVNVETLDELKKSYRCSKFNCKYN